MAINYTFLCECIFTAAVNYGRHCGFAGISQLQYRRKKLLEVAIVYLKSYFILNVENGLHLQNRVCYR